MAATLIEPDDEHSDTLRVLVIEDVATIAASIQLALQQAAITTELAFTGAEAIALHASFAPDIVLVDLGLPDMDGIDLVARFAAQGGCGIIIITASGEEADRVRGLETGADDYIVKPLALRELIARVRALHRRIRSAATTPGAAAGGIMVDHARRLVRGEDGRSTALTEAEYLALHTLIEAAGTSVSREWLSKVALRRTLHHEDRSVDQLILKLRRKLAEHGASTRSILSVRGQGYVVADPAMFKALPEG